MPFETTQPQLASRQTQLLASGWRIESVVKAGQGNGRTIFARCVG